MPTVHTSTDETPPILVVLYDHTIEPDATVAPEGTLRFTVMNRAEEAKDFVVVKDGHLATRVCVAPNDSTDVRVKLGEGRHVLACTAPGAMNTPSDAKAELTVQPAATYDVTSTPPERTEDPS